MENASKALIMAGGVLISLLVIGLLVFFFNNLSELQRIEQSADEIQSITEFNKQYDVYQRNVYGSELFSIANKINDYNKRESDNKGYSKIKLLVEISNDMDENYFKKGTYTASELEKEIEKLKSKVDELAEKEITITNKLGKKVTLKIKKISSMRTKELEDLGFKRQDYNEELTEYNTYKTLYTQVKSQVYTYVNFDYDKYNGRITEMKYKI